MFLYLLMNVWMTGQGISQSIPAVVNVYVHSIGNNIIINMHSMSIPTYMYMYVWLTLHKGLQL